MLEFASSAVNRWRGFWPRRSWAPALLSAGLSSFICFATLTSILAEDVVEFLNGARIEGTVTQIDTKQKRITFEIQIAGRNFERVYPYSKVHAVTYRGKRYVLTEKSSSPISDDSTGNSQQVSRADVQQLITDAGRTPPAWYDSTSLDYPNSLDLSWPDKPKGGWNNQKNVGQYVWDVINPNPGRWKSGVRFMHHLLTVHQDDSEKLRKVMNELGRMYHELLQDYARAAFWYQKAGVGQGSPFDRSKNGAHLAECYWRLGNRPMAVELLDKLIRCSDGGALFR